MSLKINHPHGFELQQNNIPHRFHCSLLGNELLFGVGHTLTDHLPLKHIASILHQLSLYISHELDFSAFNVSSELFLAEVFFELFERLFVSNWVHEDAFVPFHLEFGLGFEELLDDLGFDLHDFGFSFGLDGAFGGFAVGKIIGVDDVA